MPRTKKNAKKTSQKIQIGKKKISLQIGAIEPSPCTVVCPAGTNVKAYVSLIAAGQFDAALDLIRKTNPFPGICGRVCPHECENECNRGEADSPIAIAMLKRFVADYELRRGVIPAMQPTDQKRGNVAVIGAGPSGLTCAADLARDGYKVTVYEALPVAGGMLAVGIPAYRLPREILRIEIAAIESLGVKIQLNSPVGKKVKFEDLTKKYDAVYIAAGAQTARKLGIPGESEAASGVFDCIKFLRESSLGNIDKPGENVVVIGGGNTAVDSARTALRLGTKKVTILYRRSRDEMPAYEEEIIDAEQEGVKLHLLAAPVRLLVDNGVLSGVECVKMKLGPKDKSGRRRPEPVKNSEFTIKCDAIIPAISQEPDYSFLPGKNAPKVTHKQLIAVDNDTMVTSKKGIFAGGDVVSGPSSVIEAIAAGHRAAMAINRHIQGLPLKCKPAKLQLELGEMSLEIAPPKKARRVSGSRLAPKNRAGSFAEVEQGLSESQAVTEAQRCLRCGPCMECSECVGVCDGRQVILEPSGLSATDMMKTPGTIVRVPNKIHSEIAKHGSVPAKYNGKEHSASVYTACVDEHLCVGCGACEEVCEYRAIRVAYGGNGIFTAKVDEDMCRGCGTCVSHCPTNAIDQHHVSAERINTLAEFIAAKRGTPKVLVFACRWSAALKAAAEKDLANVITVMCLGRILPGTVLRAFENGIDGVLMLGCAEEECHYGFGSARAAENMKRISEIMPLIGLKNRKMRIMQIQNAGPTLAEVINGFKSELTNRKKNGK